MLCFDYTSLRFNSYYIICHLVYFSDTRIPYNLSSGIFFVSNWILKTISCHIVDVYLIDLPYYKEKEEKTYYMT